VRDPEQPEANSFDLLSFGWPLPRPPSAHSLCHQRCLTVCGSCSYLSFTLSPPDPRLRLLVFGDRLEDPLHSELAGSPRNCRPRTRRRSRTSHRLRGGRHLGGASTGSASHPRTGQTPRRPLPGALAPAQQRLSGLPSLTGCGLGASILIGTRTQRRQPADARVPSGSLGVAPGHRAGADGGSSPARGSRPSALLSVDL